MHFEMQSYAKQDVSFYCELCGIAESSLKHVPAPALPEANMTDEEAEQQGVLHRDAAKALMRLLWLSRLSRPDLSFIIGRLAASVSCWTKRDDRQLHRVISYVNSTIGHHCCGRISYGHPPKIRAFSDADFASCPRTGKSTSGIVIGIQTGPSFYPVFWQSSVARSTPEAELIAFAATLFGETLHIQDMMQYWFETSIPVVVGTGQRSRVEDYSKPILRETETLQSCSQSQYSIGL